MQDGAGMSKRTRCRAGHRNPTAEKNGCGPAGAPSNTTPWEVMP